MADRAENALALDVLGRLDADFLRESACWFAGGTAISLRCREFRVSRDVDFLCASREGYRAVRARVRERGAQSLFRGSVVLAREPRVDRYGVRMAIDVGGAAVKLEIVSEGRIALAGVEDPALPVARLSDEDLVAEKLLANDDRFLDDASLARDVIDLVVLEATLGELPAAAWHKAREAYGPSVERAFQRALEALKRKPASMARAFEALGVTPEARALVERRVEGIAVEE